MFSYVVLRRSSPLLPLFSPPTANPLRSSCHSRPRSKFKDFVIEAYSHPELLFNAHRTISKRGKDSRSHVVFLNVNWALNWQIRGMGVIY